MKTDPKNKIALNQITLNKAKKQNAIISPVKGKDNAVKTNAQARKENETNIAVKDN